MDLAEFLLARLADDQTAADSMQHYNPDDGGYYACPALHTEPYGDLPWGEENCDCGLAARRGRALAEVEAKRGLVELHATKLTDRGIYEGRDYRSCLTCDPTPPMDAPNPGPCATLKLLALPFADHPECHPSWLPPVKV